MAALLSATGRGSLYRENASYFTPLPLARAMVRLLPFFDRPRLILEPSVGGGAFVEALLGHERSTGTYHRFMAVDIDPTAPGLATVRAEGGWAGVGDFLTIPLPRAPDVILGNPPFSIPQPAAECPTCHGKGGAWSETPRRGFEAVTGAGGGGFWKKCRKCEKTPGFYTPQPIPAIEDHIRRALEVVAPGGHVAMLARLALLETPDRRKLWEEHPAKIIHVLAERPSFTDGGTDSSAYGLFVFEQGYCGPMEIDVVSWKEAA